MDGRVWEALHVAHAFARSAEFDLVHSHLDWLPLAFAAACAHHWSRPSTGSRRSGDPAGVPSRPFCTRLDLGRGPLPGAGLRRDRAPRHRLATCCPCRPDGGDGPRRASAASIPTRAPPTAIEIARRAGRRLVICGIVQDAATSTARSSPTSTATGSPSSARSARQQRAEVLGSAAALLHPDRVRRTFRPLGRRGHGLRHARRRLPTGLDAGGGRRGCHGLRRRRRSVGGGRRGRAAPSRSPRRARACRADGSGPPAWSRITSTSTVRSSPARPSPSAPAGDWSLAGTLMMSGPMVPPAPKEQARRTPIGPPRGPGPRWRRGSDREAFVGRQRRHRLCVQARRHPCPTRPPPFASLSSGPSRPGSAASPRSLQSLVRRLRGFPRSRGRR